MGYKSFIKGVETKAKNRASRADRLVMGFSWVCVGTVLAFGLNAGLGASIIMFALIWLCKSLI